MQKEHQVTQQQVINFVSWQLRLPTAEIFPYTHLGDDLHLDNFDKMLLINKLENNMNVYLTSEEVENIETIQDVSFFFHRHAA